MSQSVGVLSLSKGNFYAWKKAYLDHAKANFGQVGDALAKGSLPDFHSKYLELLPDSFKNPASSSNSPPASGTRQATAATATAEAAEAAIFSARLSALARSEERFRDDLPKVIGDLMSHLGGEILVRVHNGSASASLPYSCSNKHKFLTQ